MWECLCGGYNWEYFGIPVGSEFSSKNTPWDRKLSFQRQNSDRVNGEWAQKSSPFKMNSQSFLIQTYTDKINHISNFNNSSFAQWHICDCCVAGLDADLLAVIPAFSRHPSLKHLMLGKNFNIKGRYGARGESTAQMAVIMMMNVFVLLSVSSGCWMKHCRNWFIWCKRKIVWVELCNILWDTHLHMYESPGGVLHRRTPTRTLYAARSHADALLSQFKFVRPVCVFNQDLPLATDGRR